MMLVGGAEREREREREREGVGWVPCDLVKWNNVGVLGSFFVADC
jgi:hypothetical protein